MSAEAALATGQLLLDAGETAQALESFRMAARAGDARGLTMLGRAAERGWGMPPDARKAGAWYRRAARSGEPWAMFNLADLHLRGEGVSLDPVEAARLYADAARHGLLQALNMLGMIAETGACGRPDPTAAQAYYAAAAERGDPWGQFNLARQLLAASRMAEALPWLDRALACRLPGFQAAVARALSLSQHPELRRRFALARDHASSPAASLSSRTSELPR
ncbi:tetratricopeptide repeat protein [uncultured Paracoccus sp.]|uniref:tetratricopeptide repeat protein n=1 Tax=uncultured Paracoccus sp. TaxID=189685 RepID=UPI00260A7057|nr:tetratricopeptide repeat protein [uncultured Paracoccus sp.]